MKYSVLSTLLLLSYFLIPCDGYRILFLAPFPVGSHWMWLNHFVRELLNRGHQVTALTNFPTPKPHPNYTEMIIDPPFDLLSVSPREWKLEGRYYSYIQNLFLLFRIGAPTTMHAFESAAGQKLLHDPDLEFDLVISEQFQQESMLFFGHKFRAPLVTISTYDFTEHLDGSKGFRPSSATIPYILLPFTENMSFKERAINVFISTLDKVIRRVYYLPQHDFLARKYFAPEGPLLPTVQEMEQRVAITLFNSHPAMTMPRPRMPSHIAVGGVHLKPSSSELPQEIKSFLDQAENGAIYFSFGSYFPTQRMPKEYLNAFIEYFKRIPHRVLWKFERNETTPEFPPNILTVDWAPQSDVLAHKNVILFINHGGVFGTQESTYYGVPMLTIPFYGDQFRNAKNAERNGHALMLNYHDITVETVEEKLNEILFNEEYRERAQEVASLFKDNPMDPMDVAMYWIEFVARHGGAPHLQSKAIDLPFWVYYNLDIYLSLIVAFFALTSIAFLIFNRLFGPKKSLGNKIKIS